MLRALELAKRGEGTVSPNPMVGCVIVKEGQIVGEGYHQLYGGPHAEVNALEAAGKKAEGATVYVTLEPCCHIGQTGPCATALLAAKVAKVVVAMRDPNPVVAGQGVALLRQMGIPVEVGDSGEEARLLNEKYLTRLEKKRPWVIAKWAMTLDGKIASRTGSSRWVSSNAARLKVHELREQADAIMIGAGTALWDDPLLTVRLPGKTVRQHPLRIVLDPFASISPESRLAKTAAEIPLLIGIDSAAPRAKVKQLEEAGCEILVLPERLRVSSFHAEAKHRARDFRPGSSQDRTGLNHGEDPRKDYEELQKSKERLTFLFAELARRGITTLLVEGGGMLMGSLFDAKLLDEIHVFIAPKLIGGKDAVSPIKGMGIAEMMDSLNLITPGIETIGPDIHVHGKLSVHT